MCMRLKWWIQVWLGSYISVLSLDKSLNLYVSIPINETFHQVLTVTIKHPWAYLIYQILGMDWSDVTKKYLKYICFSMKRDHNCGQEHLKIFILAFDLIEISCGFMGLLWRLNCMVGTTAWFFVHCRDISTPQTCKAPELCTLLGVPMSRERALQMWSLVFNLKLWQVHIPESSLCQHSLH